MLVDDIIELIEEGDLSLAELNQIKEVIEDRIDIEECVDYITKEDDNE